MQFVDIIEAFTLKNLPHSEVELSGEIPYEKIAPYRETALTHIAAGLELSGFRKGMVPLDMALKKVGELVVLEEAVKLFARDFYPELVETRKIDVVGRPDVRITKLAPGNPVALIIRSVIYPNVVAPKKWRTIARAIPTEGVSEVTDIDVDTALKSLQQSRKQGEQVPELNDDFARSVGAFANLDELKTKMKEGIVEEKKRETKDKRRNTIIEALLKETEVEIPEIFITSEQEKMLAQLKDDIARFSISFEDYLKRLGKTEEELRNDFRQQGEKRATLQLLLNTLADEEKIIADEKDIEEEMKHAIEHFPNAKPDLLRIHIQTVLRNEKVLQMLESKT